MLPEMRFAPLTAAPDWAGPPRVSIGLPVFNGARYLEEALESLLAQTFRNFELIISDNASTDRTPDICRAYAERDPRIRYSRLPFNIGGFRNHNRVVTLAQAEYFTWAAHDDLRAPEHLARCVAVLDQDPSVVLSFTGEQLIGEQGEALPGKPFVARVGSADPAVRWGDIVLGAWVYDPHYGVVRTATLRQTGVLAQHADSDRILLGELALRGRFHRVGEPLLMRRLHSGSSVRRYPTRQEYTAWYAPEHPSKQAPLFHLDMLRGLVASLHRAHLPLATWLSCHRILIRWLTVHHYELRREVGLTRAQLRVWARHALGAHPKVIQ